MIETNKVKNLVGSYVVNDPIMDCGNLLSGSGSHGGPIELFLIPASAPRLV